MSNVSTFNFSETVIAKDFSRLITNVSQCNASDIKSNPKESQQWNFNIDKISGIVLSSGLFKSLTTTQVDHGLAALKQSLEIVANEGYLLTSQETRKTLPFGYEILMLIFGRTQEKFRQVYLQELVDLYYKEVVKLLEGYSYATKDQFDRQVKAILPLVKIETLKFLLENESPKNRRQKADLVWNITNYFQNTRLNQEDIYEVVKSKISSSNFDLKSYELVPLDQRNGHLGDYYQLKISFIFEDHNEDAVFFTKFLAAKVEVVREFLKRGPSMKEEFFYVTYLKNLKELGLTEMIDFAPNCYFSRVDDVIVLDDLTVSGLVALTPDIKLNYNSLKIVVRSLAKMHACSIIYEERLTQKEGRIVRLDEKFGKYLQEIFFVPDNEYLKSGPTDFLRYFFAKFPELTGKHSVEELIDKAQKGWNLCYQKVKKSSKFRNVICHGDVYVANMMFNFDEKKICQGATLVDFQMLRYCPPTQDLVFFLYQNSLKETLDNHFDDLIEEYYSALSNYLEDYSVDIKSIYPREEFEECVNYMKVEGIFQALFYSRFQTIDPKLREKIIQDENEIEKMKKDGFYLISKSLEETHYKKVMEGLALHFIELCNNGEL